MGPRDHPDIGTIAEYVHANPITFGADPCDERTKAAQSLSTIGVVRRPGWLRHHGSNHRPLATR